MFRDLVISAGRLLDQFGRRLGPGRTAPEAAEPANGVPQKPGVYHRLERVLLTDEVSRTVLDEFAAHRRGSRGEEEIGWVLLGHRDEREATVLAALPAGTARDAGVAHVRFHSNAQAVATRVLRQSDRRLRHLGVLHTHPGTLRHPSDGDYRGDVVWVRQLRGREGVFGIGTADGTPGPDARLAHQPRPHLQCLGELCLSWYALHADDRGYRKLPVGLTLGPDLARPLRPLWDTIERHADRLERLCCQQAGVKFQVVADGAAPRLVVHLPLAEPGNSLRLLLNGEQVRYYLIRGEDLTEVDPGEPRLDRAAYLILAELAG